MFGVMIKDIEAMDASILKGEPASGKKQKVADHMLGHQEFLLYNTNVQFIAANTHLTYLFKSNNTVITCALDTDPHAHEEFPGIFMKSITSLR